MNKWAKIILQLLAVAFFLLGLMYVPFGIWLEFNLGSRAMLGWFIYIASIGIPWSIAFVLARYSLRRNTDENDKTL